MSGKKVFIEGVDSMVARVFIKNGYSVVNDDADADIIVYTGGADISPLLYREPRLPLTAPNIERDYRCVNLYYENHEKIHVGICRGAQFLNAMCGGSMYQHVKNHQQGPHEVLDVMTKEKWLMTSCHHQMMIPTIEADILLEADEENEFLVELLRLDDDEFVLGREIEACYYPEERCFCFQPHPEYHGAPDTEAWFFNYLDTLVEQLKD